MEMIQFLFLRTAGTFSHLRKTCANASIFELATSLYSAGELAGIGRSRPEERQAHKLESTTLGGERQKRTVHSPGCINCALGKMAVSGQLETDEQAVQCVMVEGQSKSGSPPDHELDWTLPSCQLIVRRCRPSDVSIVAYTWSSVSCTR